MLCILSAYTPAAFTTYFDLNSNPSLVLTIKMSSLLAIEVTSFFSLSLPPFSTPFSKSAIVYSKGHTIPLFGA